MRGMPVALTERRPLSPPPTAPPARSCIPGLFTREALIVLLQGGLLLCRTLLTDYISRMEAYCGRAITSLVRLRARSSTRLNRHEGRPSDNLCAPAAGSLIASTALYTQRAQPSLDHLPLPITLLPLPHLSQQFDTFGRSLALFAAVGLPAAAVNAALKLGQKAMELSFQQRLGLTLHRAYTRNRAYYGGLRESGGGAGGALPVRPTWEQRGGRAASPRSCVPQGSNLCDRHALRSPFDSHSSSTPQPRPRWGA